MPEQLPSVMEVMTKARDESNGETIDLVIEHPELSGITEEMLLWWGPNIKNTERYKLWHPEDHVSFGFEVEPTTSDKYEGLVIQSAEEKIGDYPPSLLRICFGGSEEISTKIPMILSKTLGVGSILDSNNRPVSWVHHEYEETPTGLKMRSTFRFPAKIPGGFIEATRKHCLREMARLPEFLPELFHEETGK